MLVELRLGRVALLRLVLERVVRLVQAAAQLLGGLRFARDGLRELRELRVERLQLLLARSVRGLVLGGVLLGLGLGDLGLGHALTVELHHAANALDLGLLCTQLHATRLEYLLLERVDLGLDRRAVPLELLERAGVLCKLRVQLPDALCVGRVHAAPGAQLLDPQLLLAHPLRAGAEVHLEHCEPAVDLRHTLLRLLVQLRELRERLAVAAQLLLGELVLFLELGCVLRRHVRAAERGAHRAAEHLVPATGHGAALVDQLPLLGDNAPALAGVRDPVRLLQVASHERIAELVVERGGEALVLRAHQVKQPRHALGCLDRLHQRRLDLEAVEQDKIGAAEPVLAQVFDALLPGLDTLDDQVVQPGARRADRHVVPVIDRAQVAEPPVEAGEEPELRLPEQAALHVAARPVRGRRLPSLVRLPPRRLRAGGELRLVPLHLGKPRLVLGVALFDFGTLRTQAGLLLLLLLEAQTQLLERRRGVLGMVRSFLLARREQVALLLRHVARRGAVADLGAPRRELLLLGVDRRAERLRLALEPLADCLERALLTRQRGLVLRELLTQVCKLLAGVLRRGACRGRGVPVVRGALGQLLALAVEQLAACLELDDLLLRLLKLACGGRHLRGDGVELAQGGVVLGAERLGALRRVCVLLHLGVDLRAQRIDPLCGVGDVHAALVHVQLPERGALPGELVMVAQVLERLAAARLEVLELALHDLEALQLLGARLAGLVHGARMLLDRLLVPAGADDVLEVLEKALIVLRLALGRHLRNALDLALQDQEPLVVQVDPAPAEQRGDFGVVGPLPVDRVLRLVVAERGAGNHQGAVRHDAVVVRARQVHNVMEPDFDGAAARLLRPVAVVDQLAEPALAHLVCAPAKHKQERVDHIALPAAVGPDHA